MNRKLLTLLLLFFCATGLSAQETRLTSKQQAFRIGISVAPLYDYFVTFKADPFKEIMEDISISNDISPDYIYGDYDGTRRMFSGVNAEYSIDLSKRFTLAATAYFGVAWNEVYKYNGQYKGMEKGFSLSILPTAKVRYIKKKSFELYSSISLGVQTSHYQGETNFGFTFQLTPIGLTLGNKVFWYFDFGAGFQYFPYNIGIGYKF